jgi:predicted nucleotidyltransferase
MLFGSYAYGNPTRDSDVDFLILMQGNRVHDWGIRIRDAITFDFPVDLVVRSPAEYRQRLAAGDCFLREIHEKGKVLYESSHARVGGKSGGRFPHRGARGARKKVAKLR